MSDAAPIDPEFNGQLGNPFLDDEWLADGSFGINQSQSLPLASSNQPQFHHQSPTNPGVHPLSAPMLDSIIFLQSDGTKSYNLSSLRSEFPGEAVPPGRPGPSLSQYPVALFIDRITAQETEGQGVSPQTPRQQKPSVEDGTPAPRHSCRHGCTKTFRRSSDRSRHEQKHLKQKMFLCAQPGCTHSSRAGAFYRKDHLTQHARITGHPQATTATPGATTARGSEDSSGASRSEGKKRVRDTSEAPAWKKLLWQSQVQGRRRQRQKSRDSGWK